MFEAILLDFWKVYWLRREKSMVSNFFWTDVHFTARMEQTQKQKNLNNSKTIIAILMKLYLHVALIAENFFTKIQIFMTSCCYLQTRTCFQELVCKIHFKHQNDVKLCKLITIDIINHLWKFHKNRIHRSEVISWSVNY